MSQSIDEHRVLLTGGSGGMGSAIHRRLEDCGSQVVILDNTRPSNDCLSYINVDMGMRGATYAAVKQAHKEHGPFQAIINCVGYYGCWRLEDFSWPEYEHCMQINARAPLEAILSWLNCRSESNRAVVVNITSAGAMTGSRDLAYAASKSALQGATRSLARSLADCNVFVFGVAPGIIDTNMSRRMPLDRFEEHTASTFLKRAGTTEEIADLVSFLVRGKSDYMTGSIINISCGLVP